MSKIDTMTFMASPQITAVEVRYWLSEGIDLVYPVRVPRNDDDGCLRKKDTTVTYA